MWVVRISARETLVITAFCRPMMKQSSTTVSGTNRWAATAMAPPNKPNTSSKRRFQQQRAGHKRCASGGACPSSPAGQCTWHRSQRPAAWPAPTSASAGVAQHQSVGHAGHHAGHVGCVLVHWPESRRHSPPLPRQASVTPRRVLACGCAAHRSNHGSGGSCCGTGVCCA